jgi:hypothetical protein
LGDEIYPFQKYDAYWVFKQSKKRGTFMRLNHKLLLALSATALISACGSDGGTSTQTAAAAAGSNSSSGSTGGATTVPSAATGAVASSQASANELVAAVNSSVATLRRAEAADSAPGFGTPSGTAIPGLCTTGTADVNDAAFTSANLTGSTITMTFGNCVVAGVTPAVTYNGGYSIFFDRYTADFSNYKFTSTYNNFSVAIAGLPVESFTGSISCEKVGTAESCSSLVDGVLISGNLDVTTSGSTTNVRSATIRGNIASAGGYVDCVYSNWTYTGSFATGGTVTITGLNNTRAVITTTATGYTVAITSGGTTTNYTVGRA